MQPLDFNTSLNGVGNDLKIAIDDIIGVIATIHSDVEKLKTKTSKPDSITAKALLEYIAMEEGKAKANIKILCGAEIEQYLKWLDEYCLEHMCTQEQALNWIIEGEI